MNGDGIYYLIAVVGNFQESGDIKLVHKATYSLISQKVESITFERPIEVSADCLLDTKEEFPRARNFSLSTASEREGTCMLYQAAR